MERWSGLSLPVRGRKRAAYVPLRTVDGRRRRRKPFNSVPRWVRAPIAAEILSGVMRGQTLTDTQLLLELVGDAYAFEDLAEFRHGVLETITRVVPCDRVAGFDRPDPLGPSGL